LSPKALGPEETFTGVLPHPPLNAIKNVVVASGTSVRARRGVGRARSQTGNVTLTFVSRHGASPGAGGVLRLRRVGYRYALLVSEELWVNSPNILKSRVSRFEGGPDPRPVSRALGCLRLQNF